MPILPRGSSRANFYHSYFARGFTLLEIIVALAIVAALTGVGLVALRFDSGEQLVDEQVQRFSAFYRGVQDEALLGGKPLRWSFYGGKESWQLLLEKRQNGNWQPFRLDEQDGKVLGDAQISFKLQPQTPVYLFPSGQSSPFQLSVQHGDNRRRINGDSLGRLTVTVP